MRDPDMLAHDRCFLKGIGRCGAKNVTFVELGAFASLPHLTAHVAELEATKAPIYVSMRPRSVDSV